MSKVRLFQSVFVVCASVSMMMCSPVSEEEEGEIVSAEEGISAQLFTGRVIDENGAAIAGARVTINGILRTTSSTGSYAVSIIESTSGYAFDIRKDGYGPLTLSRTKGKTGLVHTMKAAFTMTIAPTRPAVIVEPSSGIQVTIPANSLRSGTGTPVGNVRFSIIPHTAQTMPGDLTGRRPDGTKVALLSVGAVTLQAVDSAGSTLGLKDGSSLTVQMPVPAEAGGVMPRCAIQNSALAVFCRIPMWRFDPATGVWIEQPNAEPTTNPGSTNFFVRGGPGPVLDANGLGSWNADVDMGTQSACVRIQISGFQPNCYLSNTGSGDGIRINFRQVPTLTANNSNFKSLWVAEDEPFVVLRNLEPITPLSLSFKLPNSDCMPGVVVTSNTTPTTPDIPAHVAPHDSNLKISVSAGPAWNGTGVPSNPEISCTTLVELQDFLIP